MSQINYQAPKLTDYKIGKKSKGNLLGTIAGGVSQFGIGMAGAWSKANDAQKAKFPEWFKKLASYEPKTAKPEDKPIESAQVKELSDVLPVDQKSTYVPIDKTKSPELDSPEVSTLTSADHPDFTPQPVDKSDYASSWNEGESANNADVKITPIDESPSIHPVDLTGNN